MASEQIDQTTAEGFADKFIGIISGAALALMSSVGHRAGLFDTIANLPPSTSEAIAKAAGLNERYVREWLGAMVTGDIIEYDHTTRTYHLPSEHAAFLTTAAGPDNLAYFTQYFPLLGNVEDEILHSFRNGGGVPYSSYPRFQELQAGETARVFDATLVDVTLPLVPGLLERLQAGIDVVDVGTGAGHAVNVMARAFPNSRFLGYDFSVEGVSAGRAEAAAWGLTNTTFEVKDVATIDDAERFDLITAFDTIHDQKDPRGVLSNVARALKPDGTFLMVDIAASSKLEENLGNPWAPLFYTWSTLHCMTVSLAQGGEGLGTAWGTQLARDMLKEAGFSQILEEQVDGDPINVYFIARK